MELIIILLAVVVIGLCGFALWQDREIKKREMLLREIARGYVELWEAKGKEIIGFKVTSSDESLEPKCEIRPIDKDDDRHL